MIHIDEITASFNATRTEVVGAQRIREYKKGKKTLESKKAEEERKIEESKKVQTIQQTYSSRGKIIERAIMGRQIDTLY